MAGFGLFELRRGAANRESGAEAVPEVPEAAVLIEVSWTQTAMSADDCFWFTAGRPQWDTEADGLFLNCEFRTPDGGFAERRDAPLTDAQWAELEALVRLPGLVPYVPPDENLLDAPGGEITVTWEYGGEKLRQRYAPEGSEALGTFLRALAAHTQSSCEKTEN